MKREEKKKHRGCLTLIPGLLVIAALTWTVLQCVSHKRPEPKDYANQLTVLTYNTHQMEMYTKAHQNRIIHYLQRQNADIVCLQEVDVYKDDKYLTLPELKKAMSQYPYSYFDFKIYNKRHQYGVAVFSKYPLSNKNTIRYTSLGNISNYCDVAVGKDTFRLFNNHLESNRLVVSDLPDSIESEALRESAHRISDKLGSARKIRRAQAVAVREEINQSPYPVIVAGDFNDTPLSYTYQKIKGGKLRDCFLESSVGRLGFTLTKHHIGIRIDYILCSSQLHPLGTRIDRVNYSDHYPMIVTLAW